MFGNYVLRLCSRVAVKLNFRTYIRQYTSPNKNFEYSYPLTVNPDTFARILFSQIAIKDIFGTLNIHD